jgi:hypothetical protein
VDDPDRDKVSPAELHLFILGGRLLQILALICGGKNIAIWLNTFADGGDFLWACLIVGSVNLWSIFYVEGMVRDAKSKLQKDK